MKLRMWNLVLASALVSSATSAGTIRLKVDLNKSLLTKVSISANSGASFEKVFAGQEQVIRTGGTDLIQTPNGDFLTFCIETAQQLSSGLFKVLPLPQGDNSAGGLGNFRAAQISQLIARNTTSLYNPLTPTMGAALQIAIWEVADEPAHGTYDLSSGVFRAVAPAPIITLSQSYLNALTVGGPVFTNLAAAVSNYYQDVLLQDGSPGIVFTPEPGALALFGLGAVGLLARRRFR